MASRTAFSEGTGPVAQTGAIEVKALATVGPRADKNDSLVSFTAGIGAILSLVLMLGSTVALLKRKAAA
jgi:hypothetical protein